MKPEHAMARHSLAVMPSDKKSEKKTHPSGEGESHGAIHHMEIHPAKHKGGQGFIIHHHPKEPMGDVEKHMAPDLESLKDHLEEHAASMHGNPEPTEMAGGGQAGADISG